MGNDLKSNKRIWALGEGASEFSKHLDVEGQVLKHSSWGGVRREKELCAQLRGLSSVLTVVVRRPGRPSRSTEDFSKAPLFVSECSSLSVSSRGTCEEMEVSHGQ